MNSFDLFDTLVAGRDIRIAAGNQPGQFPIAENIAKVQAGDLIVSDYEHPELAAAVLQRICKLRNNLVVSPDGKWKGTVWPCLPEMPSHHTGDNMRADFESPIEHGIDATVSTLHRLTEPEDFVLKRIPQLAMLMREARLRTFGEYRGIELMQANYNFPVLFCASIMLNRLFPAPRPLLMSARDCYMWLRLMTRLFGRGEYWYTSCKMRLNADEGYHRYIQSFGPDPVLVDLCGSGNSLSHLAGYESLLMFTPEKSQWHVPALWRGPDVWRLEQANRAPHQKCTAVKYFPGGEPEFQVQFLDSGVDCANEPHIQAQCDTFFLAIELLDHYDVAGMLSANDDVCLQIIQYMLPHYVDFKNDVEALRLIDIQEDAL